MAEVAEVGGDHRHAGRVDGGHDLLVAHRPAGLDDRADARVDRQLRAVGEREVRVGGQRRAGAAIGRAGTRRGPSRSRSAPRPPCSSGRRRSRSWRRRRRSRSRWSARGGRPSTRTASSCHSDSLGARALITRICSRVSATTSRVCTSWPPITGLRFDLAGWAPASSRELEQAHVLLHLQHLQRVRVVAGREQHLDELLAPAPRRTRGRPAG